MEGEFPLGKQRAERASARRRRPNTWRSRLPCGDDGAGVVMGRGAEGFAMSTQTIWHFAGAVAALPGADDGFIPTLTHARTHVRTSINMQTNR